MVDISDMNLTLELANQGYSFLTGIKRRLRLIIFTIASTKDARSHDFHNFKNCFLYLFSSPERHFVS